MILFLSCSQPSGDRSLPSYEESISSLQIPKKLPPINFERSQAVATTDTSLRGYGNIFYISGSRFRIESDHL